MFSNFSQSHLNLEPVQVCQALEATVGRVLTVSFGRAAVEEV